MNQLQAYSERILTNFPQEMLEIPRWLLWKAAWDGERVAKLPVNGDGYKISVKDKSKLYSVKSALMLLGNGKASGIGFSFFDDDPWTGIDLDHTNNPEKKLLQKQIYDTCQSYSEFSPSGKGLHIIVKGKIPQGINKKPVEIYPNDRYLTVTGNCVGYTKIRDCQPIISSLWEHLTNGLIVPKTTPAEVQFCREKNNISTVDDMEILTRVCSTEKGIKLCRGEYEEDGDKSSVDMQLIYLIIEAGAGFDQAKRCFRLTELGKRDKANRDDYLDYNITKAFEKTAISLHHKVSVDAIVEKMQVKEEKKKSSVTLNYCKDSPYLLTKLERNFTFENPRLSVEKYSHIKLFPQVMAKFGNGFKFLPGLVGDIARYIFTASPHPSPEISQISALAFMAGMFGRQYNISNVGLNLHIILMARTGIGKGAAISGINAICNAVEKINPSIRDHIFGGTFGSAEALLRGLSEKPGSMCVINEISSLFREMSNQNNEIADKKRRAFLATYDSGKNYKIMASLYADKSKHICDIEQPAFTVFGDSQAETFLEILDTKAISTGTLPRLIIFPYDGLKPYRNDLCENVEIDPLLVENIATILSNYEVLKSGKTVIDIPMTPDAKEFMSNFDNSCVDLCNNTHDAEFRSELFNRSGLNARKIAALLAVSENYQNPIVTLEYCEFAVGMITQSIKYMTSKFESGETGSANIQAKQLNLMKTVIGQYFKSTGDVKVKEHLRSRGIITHKYLVDRLISNNIYQMDNWGATTAIKRNIEQMENHGYLERIPQKIVKEQLHENLICYKLNTA